MKLYPDGSWELSVEEYLAIVKPEVVHDISIAIPVPKQVIEAIEPEVVHKSAKNNPGELTSKDLEQIKQIKQLWMDKKLSGKEIAERVGININKVYYWRKNTPKEYKEKVVG